ncbi:16S rRNA (guanine(527)-N(7))-methyltransferase RsmG [Litorisediminicola beolgyonensis]|uniref:Ribosomal RNA small subunit methyltransferase G n=1 Tax=Litorisediminicola beolgyonensis TaxID=1173614 RepID=A0ABW3ZDG4_9RHOB
MNVSRETQERLATYAQLLRKWNPKVNLVAPGTINDLETRHIADSAQVHAIARRTDDHWVDLGTGGGFPGLVACILSAETAPELQFTFVESDQRKATFLRTVLRETGLSATVIAKRIEKIPPLSADILSARALAPLDTLLDLALPHGTADTQFLFPKGANWKKEVDNARRRWSFDLEIHKSDLDPQSVILELGDVRNV